MASKAKGMKRLEACVERLEMLAEELKRRVRTRTPLHVLDEDGDT
jgi:hypothetical protein